MNMTKPNDQGKRAARKTAWVVGLIALTVYVVFIASTLFGAGS